MLYHKYDPQTLLYVESVEADKQPEHSIGGDLPDQTEHYTLAHIDGAWVSVLRPEFEIIDNTIQKKPSAEEPVSPSPVVEE
jgi:hypothetical protein